MVSGRSGTTYRWTPADVVAVKGNPLQNIQTMEAPIFVMKDGAIVVH